MTVPGDRSGHPGVPADAARRGPICDASQRRWILAAAILISAMGFIDGTVVAIAMPDMRASLGAGLAGIQWIANAYMLSLAALMLVGGALGDRYGLPRTVATGLGIFTAASLACTVARTPETMIAARFVQGAGAALMIPGALALIARAYPDHLRGRAIGTWASASAITTAAGPILGGALLTWGGPEAWRLIFAVNLPVGLVAGWILIARTLPDRGTGRAIDWPGAALATLGLGAIAYALGGEGEAAADSHAGPATAIGLACLAAFLAVESRAPAPMLPLGLFRQPVFAIANVVTFVIYFALSALLFYLPLTVITAWGVSELAASAAFLPLTVFVAALSTPVGGLVDRLGAGRPIALGAGIVAAGLAALAVTFPAQAYWTATLPSMALVGLGMGLVAGPVSTAVMGAVPPQSTGIGSAVNNAVTRMAGLLAVAAMGGLAAMLYAAAGGPAGFAADDAGGPGHAAAMTAAMTGIAWTLAAITALGAILAALRLMPATRPRREAG